MLTEVCHTHAAAASAVLALQPAQLCVSEIVDVGLLGEFCLPTMAHARANLLAADAQATQPAECQWCDCVAQIIPCSATIHACLVQVGRDAPAPLRRCSAGSAGCPDRCEGCVLQAARC